MEKNSLDNFICHLSFLKKLSPIHTHPLISIHEFLKPYELLCLEFESFIKGWMWIGKKNHPIILSVTCHCLRNFPHSYTSPHIHSWIFKILWVIISWVWVILKIWCHKHGWVGHAGIEWVIQGWHMSCRDETGWVISGWGRWELQGTDLEMPQGIKSDRTIMEMQDIESLTPKYWKY